MAFNKPERWRIEHEIRVKRVKDPEPLPDWFVPLIIALIIAGFLFSK